MAVIDLCHIIEDQRFALGDEIERLVDDAVGPGRRAVMGIARRLHHAQRRFDRGDRGLLFRRQRGRDIMPLRVDIFERVSR